MSIRSVGNQLLQTAPSPLLSGASTASLSMWVRVNPGSVVSPAGVQLFGDGGGKLSVGLSGSGDLQVGWSSNDGKADGGSSCDQPLVPGVDYHVAATWQDGAQQYYLNGVLVHSDTQHGTLGKLGDQQPHPFQLGSSVAGVDVTLDEPTLWVGYALTAADVKNLRDRIVHPEGISPTSIALRWSLAGADGVAARVGDAGLADASATGLNLSSVVGTTPAYQKGVLSFVFPDGGCQASVAPSGQAILFLFHDEASIPVNVNSLSSQDEVQAIALSGSGPAVSRFKLTLGGQSTAPIAVSSAPPAVSFTWAATLGAAGSFDLAVARPTYGDESFAVHTYEVFDGGALLGTVTRNLATGAGNPATFQDGTASRGGGPVDWLPLGRFKFSGKACRVRVSGQPVDPGNFLYASGLRVATADGATVQRLDASVPPAVEVAPPANSNFYGAGYDYGTAPAFRDTAGGAGSYPVLDPAAVRSALEALPNVGAGNITVTGRGLASDPLLVTFSGPLTKKAVPLLVSSDAGVVVTEVSAGGNWPKVSINGGAPIALENPYWGVTAPAYLPVVMFPLRQAAPAVLHEAIMTHENTVDGGWGQVAGGYGLFTQSADGIGPTAKWQRMGTGPGTYRLSVTWSVVAGASKDVVYTVTNARGTINEVHHLSQAAAPSGDTDGGVAWQVLGSYTLTEVGDGLVITLTNNAAGTVVADSARFQRTSADDTIRIKSGDIVTYSAGTGWATTASGPAKAASSVAVRNNVGGTIYPAVPPGPKTMKAGWNISKVNRNDTSMVYSNVAAVVQWPQEIVGIDADYYPTKLANGRVDVVVLDPARDEAGDGRGMPSPPNGRYTLLWDGASDLRLSGGTEVGTGITGQATGNRRVYDLQGGPTRYGPVVVLSIAASGPADGNNQYPADVRNLRIYPPDPADRTGATAWAKPTKYYPTFLDRIAGVNTLRFLDPLGAINDNNVDFADYMPPQSRLTKFGNTKAISVPIVDVRAYTGSATYFDPRFQAIFQYKTAVPHGLMDGMIISILGFPGDDPHVIHLTNGTDTTTFVPNYDALVRVVDDTTFVVQNGPPQADDPTDPTGQRKLPPYRMTNVIHGNVGGYALMVGGNSVPLQDMVEWCNYAGADFYLNTGFLNSDDCLRQIGAYLAQHLNPGLTVRHEFTNETWNSYQPSGLACAVLTYSTGLDTTNGNNYYPYYVIRAKHHWETVKAGMASAGRGGDHRRILGGAYANDGVTSGVAATAKAYGVDFDEFATAPYLDNRPSRLSAGVDLEREADLFWVYESMTAAQHLDLFEINFTYTGYERDMARHRRALDAAGFGHVKLISYEGGPDTLVFTQWHRYEKGHAIHRHPRFHGLLQHILQVYQDGDKTVPNSGLTLMGFFYLWGADKSSGTPGEFWSAYDGTTQLAYAPGDPILDDIQINMPDRLDLVRSPTGGALSHWASLVPGSTGPKQPPPSKRSIPGRNGQIRSTGYPRGLFRPTR